MEGNSCGLMGLLYWLFSGGTEENHTQKSVKVADVPVVIQTKHPLNTSLEHYNTNPFNAVSIFRAEVCRARNQLGYADLLKGVSSLRPMEEGEDMETPLGQWEK
jgi:hypothetical protein